MARLETEVEPRIDHALLDMGHLHDGIFGVGERPSKAVGCIIQIHLADCHSLHRVT